MEFCITVASVLLPPDWLHTERFGLSNTKDSGMSCMLCVNIPEQNSETNWIYLNKMNAINLPVYRNLDFQCGKLSVSKYAGKLQQTRSLFTWSIRPLDSYKIPTKNKATFNRPSLKNKNKNLRAKFPRANAWNWIMSSVNFKSLSSSRWARTPARKNILLWPIL